MNRNRVAPQDTLAIRNFYIVSKTKKKKKKKKRKERRRKEKIISGRPEKKNSKQSQKVNPRK